jgi:chemotaxis protein MotB
MANNKRKKKAEEEENLERWLVSYADFVTLLFAFFVAMYGISQVDVKKLGKFSESMHMAFNIPVITSTDYYRGSGEKIKPTPIKPIMLAKFSLPPKLNQAEKERMEGLERVLKKIAQEIKGLGKDTHIVLGARGLEVHLGEKILFPSGRATIRPEAFPLLDKLAQTLLLVPNLIRVEGHTDNVPINTPQFPSNWELSTARAASIVRYFIDHHNFSPTRLSAAGYGEYRPIASNDTPEGRALNRRVDIIILYSSMGEKEPNNPSS